MFAMFKPDRASKAFGLLVAAGVAMGVAERSQAALVLDFSFDNSEVSGTNVTAETGQVGSIVSGTVNTGVTGVDGEAFNFNGGQVKLTANLGLSTAFTYAFWIKTNQTTGQSYVMQNQGGVGQAAILYNWSGISGGNKVGLWSGVAGGFIGAPIQLTPDGSTWTHVAWTYDGSNIRAYQDGVLVSTTAWAGSHINQTNWYLGGSNLGDAMHGTIDDFRIYNNALNDSQVLALANATPIPTPAALGGGAVLLGLGALRRRPQR